MSKTETKLSISQKVAQLDEQVEWFYSDDFVLDDALEKYQTAMKLAKEVKTDLEKLKNKVEVIADFTKS